MGTSCTVRKQNPLTVTSFTSIGAPDLNLGLGLLTWLGQICLQQYVKTINRAIRADFETFKLFSLFFYNCYQSINQLSLISITHLFPLKRSYIARTVSILYNAVLKFTTLPLCWMIEDLNEAQGFEKYT